MTDATKASPQSSRNQSVIAVDDDRRGVSATRGSRALLKRARAAGWTGDLAVFAALLVLTAIFGRAFSRLGMPSAKIYVTEVALAVVLLLALARCGLRGAFERVRRSLPVAVLLVFWLAGAVAAVRGLAEFGVSAVVQDVGLVEYSLLLPVVALVVDTPTRAALVARVLLYAGVAATLVFALAFFFAPSSAIGPDRNPASAQTIYLALVVCFVVAYAFHGVPTGRLERAVAAAALVLIALTVVRSALLALVAALAALVVLAPRRRLPKAAFAAAAVFLSIGAALVVQRAGVGWEPALEAANPLPAANPEFRAADADAALVGGTLVSGSAATGRLSHELARGDTLQIPQLTELEPGETYTVTFAVKPLERRRVAGLVGNTWGEGWGAEQWTAEPAERWQPVRETLTATAEIERLVIWPASGAARVRIDAVRVRKGDVAAPPIEATPGPRESEEGDDAPAAPDETPEKGPALVQDVGETFGGDAESGPSANVRWRLAYWEYALRWTATNPIFGVGFGQPAAFHWNGLVYDSRRGDGTDYHDVSPPHNSFVNLVFRTGLLGLLPLLGLIGIGAHRTLSAIRGGRLPALERATLVAVAAIFVFIVVIASFNVALEGPYMGIFFWTVLGLMLVSPRLFAAPADAPSSGDTSGPVSAVGALRRFGRRGRGENAGDDRGNGASPPAADGP